jgi:hypothetical protein
MAQQFKKIADTGNFGKDYIPLESEALNIVEVERDVKITKLKVKSTSCPSNTLTKLKFDYGSFNEANVKVFDNGFEFTDPGVYYIGMRNITKSSARACTTYISTWNTDMNKESFTTLMADDTVNTPSLPLIDKVAAGWQCYVSCQATAARTIPSADVDDGIIIVKLS